MTGRAFCPLYLLVLHYNNYINREPERPGKLRAHTVNYAVTAELMRLAQLTMSSISKT